MRKDRGSSPRRPTVCGINARRGRISVLSLHPSRSGRVQSSCRPAPACLRDIPSRGLADHGIRENLMALFHFGFDLRLFPPTLLPLLAC